MALPAAFLLSLLSLAAEARSFVLNSVSAEVLGEFEYIQSRDKDTLLDIARAHNVGINEIRGANPEVNMWLPGEGTDILIPSMFILPDAPRDGIVLNLAEKRLYFYPAVEADEEPYVVSFPVGIGRPEWNTPTASARVTEKLVNPTWYPPESVRKEHEANGSTLSRVVPPGPDNPLGDYAILLNLSGYLIHGTNRPYSIGMRVTHGCVRMYPEDIEALFPMVPRGASVHLVHQPYKAGVRDGQLYIEVHPPMEEEKDKGRDFKELLVVLYRALAANGMRDMIQKLDHDELEKAYQVFNEARGIPVPIGPRKEAVAEGEPGKEDAKGAS